MKILVTGGAGFIGSHVVDTYIDAGHTVTVVDDLSTGRRENVNPKAKFIHMALRDQWLTEVLAAGKFDVVNHHAAQTSVGRSVALPKVDAESNIMGTLNLLEACIASKIVGRIIYASSGGTYYGECKRPADEDDPARPVSPYGISKMAADHYIRSFCATHGIVSTILRYANVYGPRQDPKGEAGVVAIFAQQLLTGGVVTINGDGLCERDYVYVKDVAHANALALAAEGVFNIGTGTYRTVGEVLGGLLRLIPEGTEKGAPKYGPPRAGDLRRNSLSPWKAIQLLGWAPATTLDAGLHETVKYMKSRF